MGKERRQRQKLHLSSTKTLKRDEKINLTPSKKSETHSDNVVPVLPISSPKENIFAGVKLNIDDILKPSLTSVTDNDDTGSVKSTKSVKSSKSQTNPLSKKDKLKLRREVLLKKIDTVNQMKKELKIREKRKKTAIMGDTNPLLDALPTLDLLVKDRSDTKSLKNKNQKKKGIAKASRRKRELVQGIKIFKTILNDKEFKKNPLEAITKQIQVRFSKPIKKNEVKTVKK